jgi:hypothetical protein
MLQMEEPQNYYQNQQLEFTKGGPVGEGLFRIHRTTFGTQLSLRTRRVISSKWSWTELCPPDKTNIAFLLCSKGQSFANPFITFVFHGTVAWISKDFNRQENNCFWLNPQPQNLLLNPPFLEQESLVLCSIYWHVAFTFLLIVLAPWLSYHFPCSFVVLLPGNSYILNSDP